MSNRLWDGSLELTLQQKDIHKKCKWAYGEFASHRIAVVNMAFHNLCQGRRNILKCRNQELRKRLTKSLDSAGTDGFNDMKDICDHVAENITQHRSIIWTDSATKFASIPGWYDAKTRMHTPAVNGSMPDGPVNFLKALEAELKDQREAWIETYFASSDKIVKEFEKSNYDGVIEAMKQLNKDVDDLDKLAWMFDTEQVKEFDAIKKKLSYTKLLTGFNDALKDAESYRSAGFSDRQSAAFAALKLAVGLVPVFGTFYQMILDGCPALISGFKEMCDDRQRRILAVAGY